MLKFLRMHCYCKKNVVRQQNSQHVEFSRTVAMTAVTLATLHPQHLLQSLCNKVAVRTSASSALCTALPSREEWVCVRPKLGKNLFSKCIRTMYRKSFPISRIKIDIRFHSNWIFVILSLTLSHS